jgi:hypothetical protein
MNHGQGQLLDSPVQIGQRRDLDFYITPSHMTRALLRRLYLANWTVFEPCVGDGAIVNELPTHVTVRSNDIVARAPMVPDYLLDARRAESWRIFEMAGPIDLTLTNPPFDVAIDIAQHAYRRSRAGMVLLLRCTWIEPTDDRGDWLAKHPPAAQIVMPRWNFRSKDGKGGGDSVPASWFIWNKQVELVKPGIHIVTKAERDELLAAERLSK